MIRFARNVGQDILHPAVQDAAEVIDGRGGDRLVPSELVDGGAGNTVIFDEGVGGFRRAPQGFPKNDCNKSYRTLPKLFLYLSMHLFS